MTWVDGDTLEKRLRVDYGTRDALVDHLEILSKVVDAVSYAHDRGVIHRDLKPENILVGRFGRVYVTDWGIAKVWDRVRFHDERDEKARGFDAPDGVRLGTAEYMSPEQARGDNSSLGPACDTWALGVVLYQCLAGRTPFRGATVDETIANILAGEYPAASSIAGELVPRELEEIVSRALRYSPADRYPSLDDFEADLKSYLRGTYALPTRQYSSGEVIVFQGEVGREAYILQAGTCEVWADTGAAEPRRVATILAGEFFGEAALVEDTERSASVIAATDCTVSVVGRDILEREKGRTQPWMASFITTLVDRFRATNNELHRRRARNDRGLLLQAALWLQAFGKNDGGDLKGSWRGCGSHLMGFTGLKLGPLRVTLEQIENVTIDGSQDLILISRCDELMRHYATAGNVET
jgi:serine/threonine-protein kinase